jgi:hypothetical protein
MALETGRSLRRTTFVLVALASAAVEIAAGDSRPIPTSLGLAGLWIVLAAGLSWLVPVPQANRRIPPRWQLALLVLLTVAPFLMDPLRRRWTVQGDPLEIQMLLGLRNLGLGLAVFAAWPLCLYLACVVSLFLILFAVSLADQPFVLTLLGLYSATGSVWLLLVYWTGLRRFFVRQTVRLEVHARHPRLPALTVLVVVGLVSSALGLMVVGPQRTAHALGEWLPTSGGTGGFDPFARSGVNDGDDEVSGDNARSTGTIQTDTFLNSPLPSLYDMLSDMYGEPFKPKEIEKSIALDKKTRVRELDRPPADNLRPNREFPTTRRSPSQPRDPADRAARALFEVQGRTPLHVRVTAFDLFNGRSWHEAPASHPICLLDREPNSYWMKVYDPRGQAIFGQPETHQLKVTGKLGSLVPAPPHLVRFRIGRVDQANFFAWGHDRILRLAQRKTPSGTVVETESRAVDPRLLAAVRFPAWKDPTPSDFTQLPPNLAERVAALAQEWTRGAPHGWPQLDAIVQRLRSEYVLDRTTRVLEDCTDPLGEFLLHNRRGPDYQFATAAAVLPRVLGYPTRLVSGFYVSPEHYDPETQHTPVGPEDLHFWAEVRLPSGEWVVLEATPGYEVLKPPVSWSERAWGALVAAAFWTWQHLFEVSGSLLALAGLWWWRRELLDVLAVTCWRCFPGRNWQRCVQRALGLLETRGRWAGRPRLPSQTFNVWLRALFREQVAENPDLEELACLAEWACYAADLNPPWAAAEVRNVCGRVLDRWTLRRCRKLLSARLPLGVSS